MPLKLLVPKSLRLYFAKSNGQSSLFISVLLLLLLLLLHTWPSLFESLLLLGIWGTMLVRSCSHIMSHGFLVFFTCSSSPFWPLNYIHGFEYNILADDDIYVFAIPLSRVFGCLCFYPLGYIIGIWTLSQKHTCSSHPLPQIHCFSSYSFLR